MEFTEIAQTVEIPEGTMKSIEVKGKSILIAHAGDNYYALDNKCTHMQGNLSKGKLNGTVVTCPLHGSQFELATGTCIRGPKIGFITLKTGDLAIYPLKIESTKILIGL
jgi:3-phenylpropionate/trans-cinnamate dioxygenase ferredoxin component